RGPRHFDPYNLEQRRVGDERLSRFTERHREGRWEQAPAALFVYRSAGRTRRCAHRGLERLNPVDDLPRFLLLLLILLLGAAAPHIFHAAPPGGRDGAAP